MLNRIAQKIVVGVLHACSLTCLAIAVRLLSSQVAEDFKALLGGCAHTHTHSHTLAMDIWHQKFTMCGLHEEVGISQQFMPSASKKRATLFLLAHTVLSDDPSTSSADKTAASLRSVPPLHFET